MARPTVGSLFSGIGGLDLGLERAGFEIRWFCEADPYCRRILARHWPGVPCYEDARVLPRVLPEQVDLIVGGFPCQPVSAASLFAVGEADPRWGWPWMLRWIETLRPKNVLIENVPGLLSTRFRHLAERVRSDLRVGGFEVDRWERIPAGGLGAPHKRERAFLAAHRDRGQSQRGGVLADLAQEAQAAQREAPQWQWIWAYPGQLRSNLGRVGSRSQGWAPEPGVVRVADGPASRVDRSRIRAVGNAVCPPVAEAIGRELIKLF